MPSRPPREQKCYLALSMNSDASEASPQTDMLARSLGTAPSNGSGIFGQILPTAVQQYSLAGLRMHLLAELPVMGFGSHLERHNMA